MAMLISPSAVWMGFGRVPLRERLKNAATSSSTARCMTSRAPSRPSSVKCSLLSPSPLVSNSSICCSNRALEAILAILSIWRSSPFGGFGTTYRGRLRHLTFTACRGRDLTGRWAFASGIQHSTWVWATAVVMDGDTPAPGAAGQPATRICLVPADEAVVQDTWCTAGLRGTGSHHFVLEDVFVPAERAIDPAPILMGSANGAWHPYPMYRCPTLLVSGFAGVQLGLAREALDEFANLAQTKTPWQARQPLREQNRIQTAVARAQAQIESARAYVHTTLGDLWDSVAATGRSSADQRARALLAQVPASDNALDVVGTIAHLAGSSALYTPNRFDQCLRDVRAAAAHRVVSPPIYEAAGRVFL